MLNFFKQFILNPFNTGAILPSSKSLAKEMVNLVDWKNTKTLVELGPGTGAFTEKIIKKIENKDKKIIFFGIEINQAFIKELRKKFPNTPFYNDSAENIKKYLNKNGAEYCEAIISGIPWGSFTIKIQEKLISKIAESISKDGVFLTFSYIHTSFRPHNKKFNRLLLKHFSSVKKSKLILKNIPPAFIYICKK